MQQHRSKWVPAVLAAFLFKVPIVAWLTLAASLTLTALVWDWTRQSVEDAAHHDFDNHVEKTHEAVRQRLLAYEQVLRGGIGLFAASERVTRAEWKAYVDSLKIEESFPGIQGIGFSQWIPAPDLERHIQSIRAEGFPDYTVKPAGVREEYTAIIYLEPFNLRNQQAFGYDMFSQSTRQAAMVRARDTGQTSVSGKVILKQEITKDVQAGFLMYLPLYRHGAALDSPEQRREALLGYVYSPFRMKDLMRGILGNQDQGVDLEIYDGDTIAADTMMYDDDGVPHALQSSDPPRYMHTAALPIQGHAWTLVVSSTQAFEAGIDRAKPYLVAIGGVVISLLFAGLAWVLATHRSRALALANDMTATLRERESFIRAVLDHAVDGVITIDEQGVITSLNRTAEYMFGHAETDLIGTDLRQRVDASSRAQFDAYFAEYLQGGGGKGSSIGCEVTGLRRGGETFPMEFTVSEVEQVGQRIFAVMVRDLTQRKQVDRMKSEFVSTVSHELRTPLTSIRGSLGLLNSSVAGELPDQAKGLVDVAYKNTDLLLALINDILDIEKIQSGKMEFDFRPAELMPLVEQAVANNQDYAHQYGVKIRIVSAEPGVMVNVDSGRLIQALTNLLSNAAKFSHTGGLVEVSVTREDKAVRVAVIDHGVGIPESFRERIFQKFSQADSSDSRHKGGTGLGLSITRSIIEMMGGRIGFESEAGQGSTFSFVLPEYTASQ